MAAGFRGSILPYGRMVAPAPPTTAGLRSLLARWLGGASGGTGVPVSTQIRRRLTLMGVGR